MKILLAAPLFVPGNGEANVTVIEGVLLRHTLDQPDLCVFPEASLLGGFWPPGESAWLEHAEVIPDGPSCQKVIDLAQQFRTRICVGAIERDGDEHYVTHYICGPGGLLGKQRKLFPANPTKQSAISPGQAVVPIELGNLTCTVLACSDWLLPEPTILAGLVRPSLVICPTDCFHSDQEKVVLTKLRARAADLGAHVVAVFGRTAGDSSPALNAAVCTPNGDLLLYEQGQADIPFELLVELELAQPRDVWGGFTKRWERVVKANGHY